MVSGKGKRQRNKQKNECNKMQKKLLQICDQHMQTKHAVWDVVLGVEVGGS